MKKISTGGHGLAGLNELIQEACKNQKDGTCEDPKSRLDPGSPENSFGRLFNAMDEQSQANEDQLRALASTMEENGPGEANGPADAGMAFLGQFIDHDLTLDATTELGHASGDVTRIRNFRTPRLDLDCVYGNGREVSPFLYNGAELIFGRRKQDVDGRADVNALDLQRNRFGRALIGDPRNDENLFVSQVHGRKFVQRHNELVGMETGSAEEKYKTARMNLTREYHNMIVQQFLPQVVDHAVLAPLLEQAQKGYLANKGRLVWDNAPDMPVEFSAAAFRFGHSLVRQTYDLNKDKGKQGVDIFARPGDSEGLKGFAPVDEANNLDMELFFGDSAQRASPIDTKIPAALIKLPAEVVSEEPNLAFRNMFRGQVTFGLPSGERLADYLEVDLIEPNQQTIDAGLKGNTPLWYYILHEAESRGGKLGEVGGTLVAGTLLNLMLRGKSPIFPIAGQYA